MRNTFLVLIFVIFFCACASTVNVYKPQGESVTITLNNLSKYQVEILAISDSMIYVENENKIKIARIRDVNNIYIHDYRVNPEYKIVPAILTLLFEGVVMGVAFDVDQPLWGIVSGIAMVGTIVGYTLDNIKVSFSEPFNKQEIENLRLFCRYPQGLSSEQWEILLQHLNQTDFQSLSKK